MKLFVCLLTLLLVSDSFSQPLLRRRRVRCGLKGGILGIQLVGDGRDSQQTETRKTAAAEPAPAPAAPTVVHVNVHNVNTNENSNPVSYNNKIGAVNNNVVNNNVRVQQDITNNAETNVHNNKAVSSSHVNNYGGPYAEPCEE